MTTNRRRAGRLTLRIGAMVLAGVVLLLTYGVAIEPRFILDERRYRAEIPGLDPSGPGARVAVFSDLQVGMWWSNTAMAERVVVRVVEEDPTAALLAGDFVYGGTPDVSAQVRTVTGVLRPLSDAGIPTFVVLGNHDHAVGASAELETAFDALGFTVLQNEAAEVPGTRPTTGGAEPLPVVGLAATRPGLTDVEDALGGLPTDAPRVVMMHNPTAFRDLPAGAAPLAVAGHTLCGQIALPGTPG